MMDMAHLLVMTIDLTCETWCELANGAPGHHSVLYRSGIHAALAEISHMRHFGLMASLGHMAMNLVGAGVYIEPTMALRAHPRPTSNAPGTRLGRGMPGVASYRI